MDGGVRVFTNEAWEFIWFVFINVKIGEENTEEQRKGVCYVTKFTLQNSLSYSVWASYKVIN